MSTQKLVVALEQGNDSLRKLSREAESVKVASQLIGLAIVFYDLLMQLRTGAIRLSSEALEKCLREVEEAISATQEAQGKSDAERALAVVEATEAVNLIYESSQGDATKAMGHYSSSFGGAASTSTSLSPSYPSLPYPWPRPSLWPLPPPFPPPWPWPPGPWPWPPGPRPWPREEFDPRVIDRGNWR